MILLVKDYLLVFIIVENTVRRTSQNNSKIRKWKKQLNQALRRRKTLDSSEPNWTEGPGSRA